jgi:hypothetical protein
MKDTLWHDGLHSIQIGLASTNSPIPRPRRSEIFVAEFGVLEPLLSFQNPRDVNLVGFQPACTFDINNDQLLRIAHSRPSSRLLALGNTEIKISLKRIRARFKACPKIEQLRLTVDFNTGASPQPELRVEFFAFPTSATRRRLRCVEVYVWFWEKIRVAALRLERICVSESESAIGWDGKRAGGRDSAIVFEYLDI